tara:strand:- start:195 stop:617 length:423 start_codon:yes stop_codon:yes gene_type:complete
MRTFDEASKHLSHRNIHWEFSNNTLKFYTIVNDVKIACSVIEPESNRAHEDYVVATQDEVERIITHVCGWVFMSSVRYFEDLDEPSIAEHCEGCDVLIEENDQLREELYEIEALTLKKKDYIERYDDFQSQLTCLPGSKL